MNRLALLALPLALAAPALAQEAEPVTPASIVEAAAPEEWIAIPPEDLLVMDLAPDAQGRARQVVIQLIPPPFSQPWVDNVRKLARARWWDGKSVYRVVDNWVAQWGDVSEEKPLPEGVVSPRSDYHVDVDTLGDATAAAQPASPFVWPQVDPESLALMSITATQTRLTEQGWHDRDAYAPWVEFWRGWPIANEERAIWYDENDNKVDDPGPRRPDAEQSLPPFKEVVSSDFWPIHCYAHAGVARDLAPDTGTGAELYAVIGHAPRQLDRNIAVIGRVISGIEHLSTLPRGTGEAGVYETRAEDVPIVSVRLGDELPEQPHFEYLATDSPSFARYVTSRANRNDAFYTVPAGGVDICNVQVPVRPIAP